MDRVQLNYTKHFTSDVGNEVLFVVPQEDYLSLLSLFTLIINYTIFLTKYFETLLADDAKIFKITYLLFLWCSTFTKWPS